MTFSHVDILKAVKHFNAHVKLPGATVAKVATLSEKNINVSILYPMFFTDICIRLQYVRGWGEREEGIYCYLEFSDGCERIYSDVTVRSGIAKRQTFFNYQTDVS